MTKMPLPGEEHTEEREREREKRDGTVLFDCLTALSLDDFSHMLASYEGSISIS
jgi:hypothetical protein